MTEISLLFMVAIFFVALLYASVGHGGASGYLAVLSLGTFSTLEMASSALVLNLLVAGAAFIAFGVAKHFSWRLLLPFVAGSIPAAFLGGRLSVSPNLYGGLLAAILLLAAYRLWIRIGTATEQVPTPPSLRVALPTGAGVGLLSGIVGVGGGIFLSPLLLLRQWANAKTTAAVSSAFILVNSLAGIAGRISSGQFQPGLVISLAGVAFSGGLLGAYFGAGRFSSTILKRLLAVVLLLASIKMILRLVST